MTCDQYDTCTMLVNDLIGLHGPPHRMKQPDRVVVGANMHDFSDLPTYCLSKCQRVWGASWLVLRSLGLEVFGSLGLWVFHHLYFSVELNAPVPSIIIPDLTEFASITRGRPAGKNLRKLPPKDFAPILSSTV